MTTIPECARILQSLFTDIADQAAREVGFVQRQRCLSGAVFVQAVTFGWLNNPYAALTDLRDLCGTLNADLSCQALHQRFTPAAANLLATVVQEALHHAISAAPATLPVLQRFQGVYVFDSSTISLPASLAGMLPGCGGSTPQAGQAACKVQLCVELTGGALEDLVVFDGRTNDLESPLAYRPLPEGALRLADLGFYDLNLLQRYSDEGVFWLGRLHSGTRLWHGNVKFKLLEFLRQHDAGPLDVWVELGAARVPARLLAVRIAEEVANRRRQKLRQQARKRGRTVSAERLALADWDVLITNVPADRLSLSEAFALRRVRWQVELLFKVWKSEGQLDELRGRKPYRVLCELWAKLLAQIVQHWLLLVCGGVSLLYSHRQGARRVRQLALWLLWRLDTDPTGVLKQLQKWLKRCRIQARRGRPATFQLLLDPADKQAAHGSCALT